MKMFIGFFLILSGIVAFQTFSHQRTAVESPTESTAALGADRSTVPVIVELFTSEGCSSCPPADENLSKLDKTQPIPGVEVISLGEHVDYWNRLGWTDPYSAADLSQRQRRYSDAFNQDSVYTPQMIVDGRDEFAGGNMSRARAAIIKAAQSPKATMEVLFAGNANPANTGVVKLSVHVRNLPPLSAGDSAEVLLAITENNLRSEVSTGENAGRYLRHSAVVRALTTLGDITAGQDFDAEPTLGLAKGWQRENLRAVAFVQERGTRRILGAALLGLSTK